jgi:hypothetical protein
LRRLFGGVKFAGGIIDRCRVRNLALLQQAH